MIVTLYRPAGKTELERIVGTSYRRFTTGATASAHAPLILYPERLRDHALQIARDWNTRDRASDFTGYLLRCQVEAEAGEYATQTEIWLDQTGLDRLNQALVGPIEIEERFSGDCEPSTSNLLV